MFEVRKKIALFVFLFVALAVLSYSVLGATIEGIDVKDKTITEKYNGGDKISGTVVLELEDVLKEGIFDSNFDGKISLIELLDKEGFEKIEDYSCSPSSCKESYSLSEAKSSISISDEKTYGGFVFSGDSISIDSVSMKINSNIASSCENPIEVDVLDDGEIEYIGEGYLNETCDSKKYGCFDSSANLKKAIVSSAEYCEKIELSPGGAFKVGARIENTTKGVVGELRMHLYNLDGDVLGSCNLPQHKQQTEDLECVIGYGSIEEKEYYVCLEGPFGGEFDYRIRTETDGEICGTDDLGVTKRYDYEIFARPLKFKGVNININDTTFEDKFGETLSGFIEDYIFNEYNGDCSGGCGVPISFVGSSQSLSIGNVLVEYREGNTILEENNFYELEKVQPTIDSKKELSFDLENFGFTIPLLSDSKEFRLYFEDKRLFSEKIEISEGFEFDIYPREVFVGEDTEMIVYSNRNITNSVWYFEGSTSGITTGDRVSKTFSTPGNKSIRVSAKNSEGLESDREFIIEVKGYKESYEAILNKSRKGITNIKSSLSSWPEWQKGTVLSLLKIEENDQFIENLMNTLPENASEEEYSNYISSLINKDIPEGLELVQTDNKDIMDGYSGADVGLAREFYKDNELDLRSSREAIENYYGLKYSGSIVAADHVSYQSKGKERELVTFFYIGLSNSNPKDTLVISLPEEEITLKEDYTSFDLDGGTALETRGAIEFYVERIIQPEDLGLFILPSELDINVTSVDEDEEKSNISLELILGIIFVVIGAFLVFLVFQEIYRNKYEKKLFGGKAKYLQILSQVYTLRVRKMPNFMIQRELMRQGWKIDQINYILTKMNGKKYFSWEVPLLNSSFPMKIKKELKKITGVEPNITFIKVS